MRFTEERIRPGEETESSGLHSTQTTSRTGMFYPSYSSVRWYVRNVCVAPSDSQERGRGADEGTWRAEVSATEAIGQFDGV